MILHENPYEFMSKRELVIVWVRFLLIYDLENISSYLNLFKVLSNLPKTSEVNFWKQKGWGFHGQISLHKKQPKREDIYFFNLLVAFAEVIEGGFTSHLLELSEA